MANENINENPNLLRRSYYNYELPPELIAQTPAEKRDMSRLLMLDKIPAQSNTGIFTTLSII